MNKIQALLLIILSLFLCQGTFAQTPLNQDKIVQLWALTQQPANTDVTKTRQRHLWVAMTTLNLVDLDALIKQHEGNPELLGWLQLARFSRQHQDNPNALLASLDAWQTQYASHPARRLLPEPLDAVINKLVKNPSQVALLLPLSGPIAGPGHAILDGFNSANKGKSVTVKTYDTNKADVAALYQKAMEEGAEFVIGPLLKDEVTKLSNLPHPIPTLFLNETGEALSENAYIFGLSPQAEAQQVAEKASTQGFRQALVIAPDNHWGHDVSKAFSTAWEQQGKKVADFVYYGDKEDLNQNIKSALQIPQSIERQKKIKELLGFHIETLTGRRQDFDMIFLLAYPSKARQIMPLLRYYYAADVPVFATSAVYTGQANVNRDKDLDGIMFCDIPWVFSHQMGIRNWPEPLNSYNRLYALGQQSYELTHRFNQLVLFPADGTKDAGILFLKDETRVAQVFEWARFKDGLAHSMGDVA